MARATPRPLEGRDTNRYPRHHRRDVHDLTLTDVRLHHAGRRAQRVDIPRPGRRVQDRERQRERSRERGIIRHPPHLHQRTVEVHGGHVRGQVDVVQHDRAQRGRRRVLRPQRGCTRGRGGEVPRRAGGPGGDHRGARRRRAPRRRRVDGGQRRRRGSRAEEAVSEEYEPSRHTSRYDTIRYDTTE